MELLSKRAHKSLASKRGMTLVELIASFALMAIFAVCATGVMVPFMNVFYRTNNLIRMQNVSDTVMETIISELSGATANPIAYGNNVESYYMLVTEQAVTYVNAGNMTVVMSISGGESAGGEDPGRLTLTYLNADTGGTEGAEGALDAKDIVWTLPEAAYNGFSIDKLTFEKYENSNLVTVKLKLTGRNGLEFETEKMTECYCLSADKLSDGGMGGP